MLIPPHRKTVQEGKIYSEENDANSRIKECTSSIEHKNAPQKRKLLTELGGKKSSEKTPKKGKSALSKVAHSLPPEEVMCWVEPCCNFRGGQGLSSTGARPCLCPLKETMCHGLRNMIRLSVPHSDYHNDVKVSSRTRATAMLGISN